MASDPQRVKAIREIIRDRMMQSGVDNYSFVDGQLQIGSTRYAVEACGCGEAECDGLRLRRVQQSLTGSTARRSFTLPFGTSDSQGRAEGIA